MKSLFEEWHKIATKKWDLVDGCQIGGIIRRFPVNCLCVCFYAGIYMNVCMYVALKV